MEATDFDKLLEYQALLQNSILSESKIDRKIELMSIINQLTAGPGNLVQKEHIILEATSRGFSEDEVDTLIQALVSENIIYESSPGFIKKK